MSKEYIEREAAKRALRIWITECVIDGDTESADRFRDCIDMLDSLDAADVAPVVHGRWKQSDFIPGVHACTVCGSQKNPNFRIGFGAWNYCPNCGAKMDGGTP